jgi:four helix bundle protein
VEYALDTKQHRPIEQLDFFAEYVAIAEWAWSQVVRWKPLAQDTVGKQLVRAIDRVGATLVEGDGRLSDPEAAHFFVIARASAREAGYWIERAVDRELIEATEAAERLKTLDEATRKLNVLIRYRRTHGYSGRVRESALDDKLYRLTD